MTYYPRTYQLPLWVIDLYVTGDELPHIVTPFPKKRNCENTPMTSASPT
jgi:hypothetical protein